MRQTGRVSGILLPLFSLRTRRDFGIGDFGGLDGLFAWMGRARQKMLMLLPLLPTAPGDSSPYATRSAIGLNALFIDLFQVPEFVEGGGEDSLLPEEKEWLAEARAAERIQYERVFALKGGALRRAFDRFVETRLRTGADEAKAFLAWQEDQKGWLPDFALFSAISKDQGQKPWWEWPAELRDRDPRVLEGTRKRLAREVMFQAWQQWVAETQWKKVRDQARRHGVLLCGDEPFIIGQDSSDCWVNPTLLRRDARLGVPPDAFSADGQDWGLPYFDFAAMEKEGYQWLRYRAKKSAAYYDLRRVDHAVGYFRQWIRDAKTPKGRFIPEADDKTHDALGERNFKILSEDAGIVAEDLGVIPPWVRVTLAKLGLPGYRVMRWERDEAVYRNPREYPKSSLATTGTHDTDTLREWWEGATDDERKAVAAVYPEVKALSKAGKEFTPEVHQALLAAAESSGSDLCVIPWQDVYGTRDRVNLPGSMTDANWSYRMAENVEDLLSKPHTVEAADRLARLTQAAGR